MTAPLPESVIRNGEIMRQFAARREWNERRLKGDVREDEDAPSVPGGAVLYGPPAVAGVVVGAVLFLIVQLVADVLGRLFGFRPGLVASGSDWRAERRRDSPCSCGGSVLEPETRGSWRPADARSAIRRTGRRC